MDEDKILYKKFLKGNKEAFDKIMDLYAEHLVYFIGRYVKRIDIAEDIAQDVFVYVLMNKEKYNFNYSLKTYLYMLGKSRALNYIKKERKVILLDENTDFEIDEDIEDIVFQNEKHTYLRQTIDKLPKNQQIAIYLTDIEELSYKDVCKVLNKNLSEVKMIIYRARKNLKTLVLREGEKYSE